MSTDQGFEINPATYEWSVRLFTLLKKLVRVNLKLHHSGDAIERGEIFLFNHFARLRNVHPAVLHLQGDRRVLLLGSGRRVLR